MHSSCAASRFSLAHVAACAGHKLVHAMCRNTAQVTAATALLTVSGQATQSAGERAWGLKAHGGGGGAD